MLIAYVKFPLILKLDIYQIFTGVKGPQTLVFLGDESSKMDPKSELLTTQLSPYFHPIRHNFRQSGQRVIAPIRERGIARITRRPRGDRCIVAEIVRQRVIGLGNGELSLPVALHGTETPQLS